MHPLYKILKNTQAKRSSNGTVWQAHDEVLDRPVALKELRSWASRPVRARACFHFAHVRRLTLSHAGLAPVHGSDCDRGWLVLDYYPQGSLAEQTDPLPAATVRRVLVDVLQTLSYLHALGFVHGAIKPANLFIPAQGPVLLADGLGVRLDDQGKPTGLRGVFQPFDSIEGKYLAPECLDGKEDRVGPGTDLYSLGWTALELLLGKDWFTSLFPLVRVAAQRWEEWHGSEEVLPPLRQLGADAPAELAAVIEGMLLKDPAQRLTLANALGLLCPPPVAAKEAPAKPNRAVGVEKKPVAIVPTPPVQQVVTPAPAIVPLACPPAAIAVRPQPGRLWLPPLLGTGLAGVALGVACSFVLPNRRTPSPVPRPDQAAVFITQKEPAPTPRVVLVEKPVPDPKVVARATQLGKELIESQKATAEARAEVQTLTQRVIRLTADLKKAHTQDTTHEVDKLTQEVTRLTADLKKAQALTPGNAVETLTREVNRLTSDLKRAQSQGAGLESTSQGHRQRADRLAGELKNAQAELARAKNEAEKHRLATGKLAAELKEAQANLTRSRAEVEEQKGRLASMSASKVVKEPVPPPAVAEKLTVPQALAALKDLGAKIEVDRTRADLPVVKVDLTGTRATSKDLYLLEGLTSLQALSLSSTAIGDPGLFYVKKLPALETLSLYDTKVTDDGLAHLKYMSHLKTLYLSSTNSDGGLIHLKKMTALETLSLYDTKVTDAGLAYLKDLTGLKTLYLSSTKVSDAGLVHLKGLLGLQKLYLSHTQVKGTGLAHLKALKNLQSLNLATTQVTDAGLAPLEDLSGLLELHLTYTQVSDAGLAHLKELSKLREVDLSFTAVTLKAVTDLRLALPGCEVHHQSMQTTQTLPR